MLRSTDKICWDRLQDILKLHDMLQDISYLETAFMMQYIIHMLTYYDWTYIIHIVTLSSLALHLSPCIAQMVRTSHWQSFWKLGRLDIYDALHTHWIPECYFPSYKLSNYPVFLDNVHRIVTINEHRLATKEPILFSLRNRVLRRQCWNTNRN